MCLHKYEWLRNQLKIFQTKYIEKDKKMLANKQNCYHIDDIWSSDILDLKDYGPENNRGYGYVPVVIDNLSKFGRTILLKNKNAQTIKDSFEIFITSSERNYKFIETDRGKEFHNNFFQDFLNKNNIKIYPRNTSLGSVFAKWFSRTIRDYYFYKKIFRM